MADKKISQLTASTTPLAGTEILPIVQGAATVKVAVSDLTAGRAVSAASLALTTALPVTSGGTGVAVSTGTVAVVLSTSPTLVTPILGAATATSIAASLGAAATPTYTFTGDLNSGIWSPAADTVAISTGGVEAIRILSTGNVAIGTTNPGAYRLRLDSAVTTKLRLFNSAGPGNIIDFSDIIAGSQIVGDSGTLQFNVNGTTERMRIDAAGSVTVGVASIATTATDGFLYIPACAGIPTGVPTTKTGFSPMVVDSTNNKLYVYVGGAWTAMN